MKCRSRKSLLVIGALFAAPGAIAQSWPDTNASLVGLQRSAIAWGDYDNDDDLDLLVSGWASKVNGEPTITALYRNDGGAFVSSGAGLVAVQSGAVAWGDYDRDGDLDVAIAGQTGIVGFGRVTKIYRNDGGTFVDIGAGLPGVNNGSLAWGDYDNDGDLDLAMSGWTGTTRLTKVYRNDGGAFSDSGVALIGVNYGQVAWADYDNDGDLDLAVCGWAGGTAHVTRIYRNQNGAFSDANAGLPGVAFGALAWGDYDNDGDLDLLISGRPQGPNSISRIYRNTNGAFADAAAGLGGADGRGAVEFCSSAWGDYDNDGYLDVVVSGWSDVLGNGFRVTRILRNNPLDGAFVNSNAGLPALQYSAAAWADHDNDGDLDIAISGQIAGADWERTRIHRNSVAITANTPPGAPGGLSAVVSGSSVTFSWSAASDGQTPASGLSYNLRVGTSPGTDNVMSGMANLATGYRRIPAIGNAQQRLSWTLHGVSLPLYWSVQAIDGAYAGGAWAPEAVVP